MHRNGVPSLGVHSEGMCPVRGCNWVPSLGARWDAEKWGAQFGGAEFGGAMG